MAKKLLFVLISASILNAFTSKNIYLTTNTLSGGTSIRPGFDFLYVWNGIGQAKNGKIYMTISNQDESQLPGSDVCIAEYNPYTNAMRSLGTVTEAYRAAGNFITGEFCNKVHTWLNGTPDGKVWLGSQDGGRGSHLLYIESATGAVRDYSRSQKYIYYYRNPVLPMLNHPELPPSDSNGVAIQDCDFTTMHVNPYAPRYIWTESYTNFYFHCWDVEADTVRSFPGGDQNMRVFVVDKSGNMWTSLGGIAMRRSFSGAARVVGRNMSTNLPSAYVYTHSYDSAFTTSRGTGNIELYDFVRDTAYPIADLPDGGNTNSSFRAITISRDDRKLYILGGSGTIYELTIATRAYKSLGTVSLAGSYAFSSGTMDSLGNWYICTWGGGRTYWVQVHMGRDTLSPLPIPDPGSGTETLPALSAATASFDVFPNPVRATAGIRLSSSFAGGKQVRISVLDQQGRVVRGFQGRPDQGKGFSATWRPDGLPSGVYVLRAETGTKTLVKKAVLIH